MTDPFRAAVDAIYASPMAVDGFYTPVDGPPWPIRLIRAFPDRRVSFGDSPRVLAGVIVNVRKWQVPAPRAGDTFHIGTDPTVGEVFRVIARPELDVENTEWRCEAEKVRDA